MVLGGTSSSHLYHMYRASIGILRFVHLFKVGLLDESSVTQYGRFNVEGWVMVLYRGKAYISFILGVWGHTPWKCVLILAI